MISGREMTPDVTSNYLDIYWRCHATLSRVLTFNGGI